MVEVPRISQWVLCTKPVHEAGEGPAWSKAASDTNRARKMNNQAKMFHTKQHDLYPEFVKNSYNSTTKGTSFRTRKEFEYMCLQRRYTNGSEAHGKTLNVIIRKMQIKATNHFTPTRTKITKNGETALESSLAVPQAVKHGLPRFIPGEGLHSFSKP